MKKSKLSAADELRREWWIQINQVGGQKPRFYGPFRRLETIQLTFGRVEGLPEVILEKAKEELYPRQGLSIGTLKTMSGLIYHDGHAGMGKNYRVSTFVNRVYTEAKQEPPDPSVFLPSAEEIESWVLQNVDPEL
jgi:hypothetical protein